MMNSILCTEVTKRYKSTCALEGLSLELGENKIYGLIGRNGAGKTTLLKAIAGQILISGGSITLSGEPVFENQRALDQICLSRGYTSAALTGRKVRGILEMCKAFYPSWDEDYAKTLLGHFDINLKKSYIQLSSGMQSAVNIIIGLASRAPFTLLDEPVAGLDVVSRDNFYSLLLEDYMHAPRTFVISTHLVEEASGIFEETIFIDKGKLLLQANTDELRGQYRYISGKSDAVERLIAGRAVIMRESVGARLTACVRMDRPIISEEGIEMKEVPLQKLFVYLTAGTDGKEAIHARESL